MEDVRRAPPGSPLREARSLFLVFASSLAMALLLARPALRTFLLDDDIVMLYIAAFEGDSWLHCLAPMYNGHWRPLHFLAHRFLYQAFGLNPLAFHLAMVGLHAVAATVFCVFQRRVMGFGRGAAAVGTALFVVHAGSWAVLLRPQSMSDALMTISILLAAIAWDAHLTSPRPWRLAATFAALTLALGSKETAIVVPIILTGWAWARLGPPGATPDSTAAAPVARFPWRPAMALLALGGLRALHIASSMTGAETRYVGGANDPGLVTANPINFFRQIADHLASAVVPYLHLIVLPVRPIALPHAAHWAIRFGLALGLGAWVLHLARRGRRLEIFALGSAVALLAPISVRTSPPMSHYLYSALPFLIVAAVAPARAAWGAASPVARRSTLVLVALWMAASIAGYAFSGTVRYHVEDAGRMERLAASAREHAADWGPGETIVLIDATGAEASLLKRPLYVQYLFWIQFPEIRPGIILVRDASAIDRPAAGPVYTFDGETLTPANR